jgi:MFS family permease
MVELQLDIKVMKFFDLIFFKFYCLTKEDGTGERPKRTSYLLEIAGTFLLGSLTFVIFGLANYRPSSFILWVLILVVNALISYFITNSYYIYSGRYEKILEQGKVYSKRRRKMFAITSLLIILMTFVILFLGGMLMSYLYSWH